MKRYFLFVMFVSILTSPTISMGADGWQNYMTVTSNFFESFNGSQRIVLTFDASFHACGWNNAADIRYEVVGQDLFKTLTSVTLSAWMGNKKLSVYVSGCANDRANVTALRIDK